MRARAGKSYLWRDDRCAWRDIGLQIQEVISTALNFSVPRYKTISLAHNSK